MRKVKTIIVMLFLIANSLLASSCQETGSVVGDNHTVSVFKCSNSFKVKASNDAVSRTFDGLELKLIRKIFKTVNEKYSSFKDKQILYSGNGLDITVRLYSSSEWFLIFKFGTTYQQARVWIPANKLEKFESLLY